MCSRAADCASGFGVAALLAVLHGPELPAGLHCGRHVVPSAGAVHDPRGAMQSPGGGGQPAAATTVAVVGLVPLQKLPTATFDREQTHHRPTPTQIKHHVRGVPRAAPGTRNPCSSRGRCCARNRPPFIGCTRAWSRAGPRCWSACRTGFSCASSWGCRVRIVIRSCDYEVGSDAFYSGPPTAIHRPAGRHQR